MIKCILTLTLLFTVTGCSFFTSRFESLAAKNNKSITRTSAHKMNFCANHERIQYISEDENSLPFYRQLGPSLFDNKNIPFMQKAIMLSLIEMSRRPDEASPYSRLQVFFQYNNQTYYYDFSPKKFDKNLKMPFLKGLEVLTKKFVPTQNLLAIASSLDSIVPKDMSVGIDFEHFLRENKADILKSDFLTERFLKGDEILTKYETFERVNYRNIIAHYMQPAYSKNEDYDYEANGIEFYKTNKDNFQIRCNVNLDSNAMSRDNTFLQDKKNSHYIGFKEGDNFFLALSSNNLIRPFSTEKSTYFIKSQAVSEPLPVCQFKGANQDIVLFSSSGRNPTQHLQHLVSYEINLIESPAAFNELLNFSRHLFLTNPDRILYESKRGRKSQLEFFLAMNFPIYHIDSLGDLFGYASFKREINGNVKLEKNLYIDDRNNTRLWCKP